eukprot:TRINITY_DN101_c0_g1_i3.p7 TRINITY_DN101_c0_g1~~TRINITY_DN101_c0_g1_i3.p7  ORF type:complete len:101 (+),score=0.75 TRINITY_DN101_c0_g1_i3:876-1178(+)
MDIDTYNLLYNEFITIFITVLNTSASRKRLGPDTKKKIPTLQFLLINVANFLHQRSTQSSLIYQPLIYRNFNNNDNIVVVSHQVHLPRKTVLKSRQTNII